MGLMYGPSNVHTVKIPTPKLNFLLLDSIDTNKNSCALYGINCSYAKYFAIWSPLVFSKLAIEVERLYGLLQKFRKAHSSKSLALLIAICENKA